MLHLRCLSELLFKSIVKRSRLAFRRHGHDKQEFHGELDLASFHTVPFYAGGALLRSDPRLLSVIPIGITS